MQKIELKVDDNTFIINTEDDNISVEILDKNGNSLGQNDYKIVEEEKEEGATEDNNDVDLPAEDAIIEEPTLPISNEKLNFPSFKEFLEKNK